MKDIAKTYNPAEVEDLTKDAEDNHEKQGQKVKRAVDISVEDAEYLLSDEA